MSNSWFSNLTSSTPQADTEEAAPKKPATLDDVLAQQP